MLKAKKGSHDCFRQFSTLLFYTIKKLVSKGIAEENHLFFIIFLFICETSMKTSFIVKIKEGRPDKKKDVEKSGGILLYTVRQRIRIYRGVDNFSSNDRSMRTRVRVEYA